MVERSNSITVPPVGLLEYQAPDMQSTNKLYGYVMIQQPTHSDPLILR